jgi:hypothetical protein
MESAHGLAHKAVVPGLFMASHSEKGNHTVLYIETPG